MEELRTQTPLRIASAILLSAFAALSARADPVYLSADFTGGLNSVTTSMKARLDAAGFNSTAFNCSTCFAATSVSGNVIYDSSVPVPSTGTVNVFSIGAIPEVANSSIYEINIDGISLQFGDAGIQGGPAVQYKNGVFNGFFFAEDFDSPNHTALQFRLEGATFNLHTASGNANLFTGFLNKGANGLTNVQEFVPPNPVPEPEIYAMLAAGLGLMGFVARRRNGQAAAA